MGVSIEHSAQELDLRYLHRLSKYSWIFPTNFLCIFTEAVIYPLIVDRDEYQRLLAQETLFIANSREHERLVVILHALTHMVPGEWVSFVFGMHSRFALQLDFRSSHGPSVLQRIVMRLSALVFHTPYVYRKNAWILDIPIPRCPEEKTLRRSIEAIVVQDGCVTRSDFKRLLLKTGKVPRTYQWLDRQEYTLLRANLGSDTTHAAVVSAEILAVVFHTETFSDVQIGTLV